MNMNIVKTLLAQLSNNLEIFILEVQNKNLNLMATDKWTVKEVLCHITSWHEYYAANYKALASGIKPPLYDGSLAARNLDSVKELAHFQTSDLINRLRLANNILGESIIVGKVEKMTYKKSGREYTTPDFLDLVSRHIATHTKQVRKAK